MERLIEDALRVQRLLPWVESDEDIINFMRKIPLDKCHLRNQLTLHYFLQQRDSFGDGFEKQIEDDAREIVIVLPETSYREIKDRLTILGNMPNRKEVVLRQLLYEKCDLAKLVNEIDVSTVKKRKSDLPNEQIFDLDSNSNETNIKIKIRKRDGSLEVVSQIEEKTSPTKVIAATVQAINEPSSSTSVSSSHFDSSTPDSTVPSTSGETNNGPCPVFPNISDTKKKISETILKSPNEDQRPSVITEISKNTSSGSGNTEDESKFNLISFLQELSQASEKKIVQLCKKLKICPTKRPSDEKLNYIINELFEDIIEVKSDESDTSVSVDTYGGSSDSSKQDTEEYKLPNSLEYLISTPQMPQDKKEAIDNPNLAPGATQFKLKEPILTLPPRTSVSDDLTLSKPVSMPNTPVVKRPILKRPIFTLPDMPPHTEANIIPAMPHTEANVIPAMPQMFMDRMSTQRSTQTPDVLMDMGTSEIDNFPAIKIGEEQPYLPEAGPSNVENKKERVLDEKLVLRLIEMFPEACPEYIRNVCNGKQWSEFDDVVTVILSAEDYPRRPQRPPSPAKEVDMEEQYEILKELLPDADPTYLRIQCEKYINDDKGLKEFIDQAMEQKNYPTMKDYLRRQQLSAQQKQYTTEFNIEHFVELFPDPKKTFSDPKRKIKIDAFSCHYLTLFFRNKFDKISARWVQQILSQNNYKVIPSNAHFEGLVKNKQTMKSRRKPVPLPDNLQNIPLLQELAYLSHKEEIETYLQEKQKRAEQERLEAKKNGLMQTCQCCYDEEVMPKDILTCPSGCSFCRECIKRSCEVALGDGKTTFSCLASCSSEFTLQTLQNVLPPKMFSKLAQKKALAEIKAAGIEELEMCPFCDFASIPNAADKIFRCLNPDCMKESCRSCKQPNHIPLKCEEVEKDEDVKARTYIENKMTEALIRKCWKCGTSFFKEEGCNKMTCSCGAQMCYICKEPVENYGHFNGIGGENYNLCPLYSDTNLLNQQNVLGAAAKAKAKIDPSKLKVDPTTDIEDHYKKRAEKLPREPHMEYLHVNAGVGPPHPHLRPPHHHHHHHLHANQLVLLREQQQRVLYWMEQRRQNRHQHH